MFDWDSPLSAAETGGPPEKLPDDLEELPPAEEEPPPALNLEGAFDAEALAGSSAAVEEPQDDGDDAQNPADEDAAETAAEGAPPPEAAEPAETIEATEVCGLDSAERTALSEALSPPPEPVEEYMPTGELTKDEGDASAATAEDGEAMMKHTEADAETWHVRLERLPYRLPSYGSGLPCPLYEYARLNDAKLEKLALDARMLLHPDASQLAADFLALLLREGSESERTLYEGMQPDDFVLRLLSRRPLTFWLPEDCYVLRTGQRGSGGFERVGTETERAPLVLEDLLSYDEMSLAALVSASVPTPFFNDGARNNCGRPGSSDSFPFDGVSVGAVGARFERECCMEHAHMVLTPQQNTVENGYGPDASGRRAEVLRLWARFYGLPHLPEWREAQEDSDAYKTLPGCLFAPEIYKRRMRMSIEPFLLDADDRARQCEAVGGSAVRARVHVVGLGVGAWALEASVQTDLMLEVYQEVMGEHELKHVGTLDFSWFGDACNRSLVQHKRIQIVFSRRSPAEPVGPEELLVAMYAWDGNAWPGNEYWDGHLDGSGDPAAACCSAIPLLQNPDLNPRLREPAAVHVLPRRLEAPRPEDEHVPVSLPQMSVEVEEDLPVLEDEDLPGFPVEAPALAEEVPVAEEVLPVPNPLLEPPPSRKVVKRVSFEDDVQLADVLNATVDELDPDDVRMSDDEPLAEPNVAVIADEAKINDVAVALAPSEEDANVARVSESLELEPLDLNAPVKLAGGDKGTIENVDEAHAKHDMHQGPAELDAQSPPQQRWAKRRQKKDEDSSPEIMLLDDPGDNDTDALLPASALEPAPEPQGEIQPLSGRRRERGGAGQKKKDLGEGGESGANDAGAAVSTLPPAAGPRRVWEGRAHMPKPQAAPAEQHEVQRTWRPRSAMATSPAAAVEAVTERRTPSGRDPAEVPSSRREWRPGGAQVASVSHGASPRPVAKAGKASRGGKPRGARPGSPKPKADEWETAVLPPHGWHPSLGLNRRSSP